MSPSILVAGKRFETDGITPELKAFEIVNSQHGTVAQTVPLDLIPSRSTSIRKSIGWIGGFECQIEAWDTPQGTLIQVEQDSACLIDPTGRTITTVNPQHPPTQLSQDLLFGPGLVQALALRGIWCLHASGTRFKGRSFAFLGESGLGKSTLAAYLAQQQDWQLIADDILPVTGSPSSILAWPSFPQLKLPPNNQPGIELPESLPLTDIILLVESDGESEPVLEPLQSTGSVKLLLSNTAGSRLFSPGTLSSHLDFCTRASSSIKAYRLNYPHRKEILPFIREQLENIC